MAAAQAGAVVFAVVVLAVLFLGLLSGCGPKDDKFNRDCERKGGVPTVKDHVRRCAPGPVPTPGPRWQ